MPLCHFSKGFRRSSVGKESACSAGDPGSILGSGRSPGEGTGYPLQYLGVSPVAQLVKNPPAMWETWVRSLGWDDPLEKGTATHSSILAWRIPWTIWSVWLQKSRTGLSDFHFHFSYVFQALKQRLLQYLSVCSFMQCTVVLNIDSTPR